jgi:lambda family phage portal protein
MNMLERALAALAPGLALDRARARMALDMVRDYDAARPNRRVESHRRLAGGPITEVQKGAAQVRALVRDQLRNNGYAQRAHRKLVSSTIGTGITGSPVLTTGKLAGRPVRDAWERYVDNADWHGDVDLYGLQMQVARAVYADGEALLRRYRLPFDANEKTPPIRWQVLEADFIDVGKFSVDANGGYIDRGIEYDANGGYIDRGIEYDANGRKVALWLHPDHPSNLTPFNRNKYKSERVPLGEVVQVYDALRPGQDRGISIFSAAVLPLIDLAGYLEREAMRKSIEACLALFITSAENPNDVAMGTATASAADGIDSLGNNLTRIAPGMIGRLKPGESIEPGPVAQLGDMTPFIMQQQFLAAAGAGVMFEHMTGDFRNVNYSSYRVGAFDFAQMIEQQQWLVFGHKMNKPLAGGFMEGAAALGVAGINGARIRWTPPPAVTSPDPLRDANADTVQLRNLTMAPSEPVERRGWEYTEMLERIAADMAAAAEILPPGTMGDADPRKNPKAAPADAAAPVENPNG